MQNNDDGGGCYWVLSGIVWVLSFAGFWIYAISEYGFMLGVSLGWIPAAIAATVVAFVWPLIVLVAGLIALWLFKQ
ncbi:MAG TPA: hypothetical protein VLA52_01450, partial [Thermohalobaculum sp.]|nr:hypothetical protein [Thermohalobaculum sp.]